MLFSIAAGSEEEDGSKYNRIFFQFAPKICVLGSSPNREGLENQCEHIEMLLPLLLGHPIFPHFLLRAEGRVAGGGTPNALLHSAGWLKGDLLAKPCQCDNWTTGFLQRISTAPKAQSVFIVFL